jgi:hypothetical protein
MSGEQMSREVKRFCNDIGTTLQALEEGTPWSNKAELYIGLLIEAVRQDLKESHSPMVFWDYCLERRARIHILTAKSNFKLHGTNAHTVTTGEEGDKSNLCRFAWYDWCYYREHTAAFPKQREVLGRVLGHARGDGNEMSQWLLKANGKVVPRRSVRPLQKAEIHSPSKLKKRQVFDELIKEKYFTIHNFSYHILRKWSFKRQAHQLFEVVPVIVPGTRTQCLQPLYFIRPACLTTECRDSNVPLYVLHSFPALVQRCGPYESTRRVSSCSGGASAYLTVASTKSLI